MSPITHFLTGWALANSTKLESRDRMIVTLACVAPDVDGLGIVPELLTRNSSHPLLWFTLYHHSMHTLLFATVVGLIAFSVARKKWVTPMLAFLSFHVHLIEDVLGSRGPDGYQWPIPYLKPFSSRLEIMWPGQWGLNAWPNVAITIALLIITLWLAWRRGFSPIEMLSAKADAVFVGTLRQRFRRTTENA